MSKNVIIIDGRNIEYEIEDLDIFAIEYYTDNPRINYIISKYPKEEITPELIEKTLLARDSTKELIHSIEENGGLLEPIIVLGNKVIEGNTRLCSYRRLYRKTNEPKWRFIKAQVFKETITQREIFAILSNYHIKGKTPWDAYEKAACINKMLEQGQTVDEISKAIGSTKNKVENMIKAYNVMKNKYLKKFDTDTQNIIDSTEELKKYSYFEALHINKNLVNRIEQTPEFTDQFVEWVYEGRIPKAQDVRELHNILDNKKARKVFIESEPDTAFLEAKEVLWWNKPDKIDGFYKKVNQFRDLIRETNSNKIKEEVSNNPNMKNVIRLCLKDLQKFCKEIDIL